VATSPKCSRQDEDNAWNPAFERFGVWLTALGSQPRFTVRLEARPTLAKDHPRDAAAEAEEARGTGLLEYGVQTQARLGSG
jgi:hypothetical protein